MILPFGLLLGTIALAPVFFPDWWARHYPKVAYSLGAITLGYYVFGLHAYQRALHVGHEYVSFIALIGSLFVVSGGIHINVKGEATPHSNTLVPVRWRAAGQPAGHHRRFDAAHPALDSDEQIPHHGASHRLLHLHRLERRRLPHAHRRPAVVPGLLEGHSVLVGGRTLLADVGGGRGLLLAMFYVIDVANYRRAPREIRTRLAEAHEQWRFDGLWNIVLSGGHPGRGLSRSPGIRARGVDVGRCRRLLVHHPEASPRSEPVQLSSDPGGGHSVHRHLRDDDARAGLAAEQRRPNGPAVPGLILLGQRPAFERAGQCADLPELSERGLRFVR